MILKQSPEDFIVEEIPLNQWNDAGPYAVFSLIKIGLNTEQAIDIINKRFHFPSNIIKYSGTKDRHAHTTQYISIPTRPNIEKIYLDEEALKLKHVGFLDEPLSLGTLKGNRFIITLRDITDADLAAFKSKGLDKFMIPNYFDEQRFSKNNYDIGLCILKKDYKKATEYLCEGSDIYSDSIRVYLTAYPNDYISALKKIPRKTLLMFIHAVQSYIFNEALSKILIEAQSPKYTENISNSDDIGRYSVKYSIGEFIFLRDAKDYANLEGTESLELVGFDTKNMNHHIKQALEAAGISPRDFVVKALPELSVEGAIRECFVEAQNIDVRILDDRAILEFELPKGSYATIVVKALFSN